MDNYYFIIVDGQQKGPYSISDLKNAGISPDAYVWREGLSDWVQASTLQELADLFVSQPTRQPEAPREPFSSQQPDYSNQERRYGDYQQPHNGSQQPRYGSQQSSYGGYRQQSPYRERGYGHYGSQDDPYRRNDPYPRYIPHTDWSGWAIGAIVLSVLLCNVLGIIFSIIGLTNANSANKFYATGNKQLGDNSNSSAKTWVIVTYCLDGLQIISSILYIAFIGSLPFLLTGV